MVRLWTPSAARTFAAPAVVFEPGTHHPFGPYTVAEHHELAGKLKLGYWLIYPHEWSAEDGGPQRWRENLQALCAARLLEVVIHTQHRMCLDVAFNAAAVPPIPQLTESVAAVAYHRDLDRPVPSELSAKAHRPAT
ncbi:hypothetical protein [Amycolatopsis anabasis]|uniref:hypothetical protein n=1 Tax=Amycolatopsis anabasis TaxID=1840409 RepID=UPI00131C136B|nr:hypothetical protein [Amycolatopsis anabasis]